MKKWNRRLATLVVAACMCAAGTPSVLAEGGEHPSPAPVTPFFSESEASGVDTGYRHQASPVVWVFIVGGVAALFGVGVLVYVNRKQPR